MDFAILSLASLIGVYMAANIGANDLANAMGTSVGSRALTLRKAVLISVIANALGAALAGGYVTNTISKGMIDPTLLANQPNNLMLGMFASLVAAGVWVNLATYLALPVSTTHAIVGAVVGFGVISVGIGAVSWGKIITIALSWVISPIAGALIAGGIFLFAEKKILSKKAPVEAAERYAPFIIFLVFLVLILSFVFKGLKNLHLNIGFFTTVLLAIPVAAAAGTLGRRWIRWQVSPKRQPRAGQEGYAPVDRLFAQLQILTACYVAFAHGANCGGHLLGDQDQARGAQRGSAFLDAPCRGRSGGRGVAGLRHPGDGDHREEYHGDHTHSGLLRGVRCSDHHFGLLPPGTSRIHHARFGRCGGRGRDHEGHGLSGSPDFKEYRFFLDRDAAVHDPVIYGSL